MAIPIFSFPQSAFPFNSSTGAKASVPAIRAAKDPAIQAAASAIDSLATGVNTLENLIRSCRSVDEAWFKVIGIGGTGYESAPLLINKDGVVALRTPDLVDVGWLGSKWDAAKTVTGAVDNGAGLIRLTIAAHGYITGNTLRVRDVGGVPNATGYWVITRISATQFDLVGSTFAGAFSSGGTAERYYGGAWFQTLFVGGTSASSAKLVADAAGNLSITGALITLTSGTKSIVLDPTTASITAADTAIDSEGVLSAGSLTFSPVTTADPTFSVGYVTIPTGTFGMSATRLSGATSYTCFYLDANTGNTLRRYDSQVGDVVQVYSGIGASAQVYFDRFRGTVETPAVAQSGDYLGDIYWRAGQGLLISPMIASQLSATAVTVAAGGVTGALSFLTNVAGSGVAERMIIYGDKIGIADSTPTATLDVGGTFRATAAATPADGSGVEVLYSGGTGYILAYNRSSSAYLPLAVSGSLLYLNYSASAGNVLVKTTSNNASGGVLQVNGDVSGSTDNARDLGTSGVQWRTIRFKTSLIQNTTTRISSGGDADFNLVKINGSTVIDAVGNADFLSYKVGGVSGISATVALAPLTGGGSAGSLTIANGIATAYTAPT